MQCFDSSGTRLEFQELETFGFLPVPEVLLEEAVRGVEVSRMSRTCLFFPLCRLAVAYFEITVPFAFPSTRTGRSNREISRQFALSPCRLVAPLCLVVTREQRVKSNPRSKVFRGEREYGERRQATMKSGKIRVKIAPDGQYLSINGAEVVPMLKKLAEKRGRCVGGEVLMFISVSAVEVLSPCRYQCVP